MAAMPLTSWRLMVVEGNRQNGLRLHKCRNSNLRVANLRTGYPGCGCTEWCHQKKVLERLGLYRSLNYTLNRDSDEDWKFLRRKCLSQLKSQAPPRWTQAMTMTDSAGSCSHQTGASGENNSVRLSIQGGHWSR